MPREPTFRELRSSLDKVWIPCQRLPVRSIGTIVGVGSLTAFSLMKLIIALQNEIVSFGIARPDRGQSLGFTWRKVRLQRIRNLL